MNKRERKRIGDAVDVMEEHPSVALGGLISRALQSDHGLYMGGVQLEDGQHGLTLAFVLDYDKASRLFAFLHDFTEGLVPTWEDYSFDQEILKHAEGTLARDGEA